MKFKKLIALLSAVTIAISSFSLTAYASNENITEPEVEDVTDKAKAVIYVHTSMNDPKAVGRSFGVLQDNNKITLNASHFNYPDGGEEIEIEYIGLLIMANEFDEVDGKQLTAEFTGLSVKAICGDTEIDITPDSNIVTSTHHIQIEELNTGVTITSTYWDVGVKFDFKELADKVTGIYKFKENDVKVTAEWTALKITTPKVAEKENAPTITIPTTEQTLTLTANNLDNDDEHHISYQGNISLFEGASVNSVKALSRNITLKINLKDISIDTVSKPNVIAVIQSTGEGNPIAGNIREQITSSNFGNDNTVTLIVPVADILSKMTEDVKGTISLLIVFDVTTDNPISTDSPVIKITFGDEPKETETTTATTTTSSGSNSPSFTVITPDDTTAAATEAPTEVVTGANGESVEAPKDVIPDGAELVVKEQTKEDAIKMVENITADDTNKETIETIKKAIKDVKAVAVDINLIKDGQKVQPNGTIKVAINIPKSLKDNIDFFVYRVEEDGTFTDVKAAVESGKIVFTTSHFSTYIITSEALYNDDAVIETTTATTVASVSEEPEDDENKFTGVATLAIIPTVIAAASLIISKKSKKTN